MKITCISDLHGELPNLPGGDLLIIAGDLTCTDSMTEHVRFADWVDKQDYVKKVIIAGNHDNRFQEWGIEATQKIYKGNKEYLCDSGTEFEGLKIWGSPWTAQFPGINHRCCAFTVNYGCDTDDRLNEYWNKIPSDTDILITHCPPYCVFDVLRNGEHVGSISLRNHVLKRINCKLHVFGHVHEHGGKLLDTNVIKFINASYIDENYDASNKIITIEI